MLTEARGVGEIRIQVSLSGKDEGTCDWGVL